jgi:cytochrome c
MMRKIYTLLFTVFVLTFYGCGNEKEEKKSGFTYETKTSNNSKASSTTKILASKKTDLKNKGIGPITSLKLPKEIDQDLAKTGEALFKKNCTACHRPDKKFIGPAATGIVSKRTPEWIMNMILNPEEMLRKDPLAKELLIEFNYAPMIKQGLKTEEARAILEYYRTLN